MLLVFGYEHSHSLFIHHKNNLMIRQLKNIDTAFKHVRLLTAVLIVASMLLIGYCFYFSLQKVAEAQEKIYVIADGKAIEATTSTRKENLPVEARDHIRMFHQYFFSFSPDEKAIESNIRKALYLADESAKQQYDAFKEKGFYSSLVSANVSQLVTCDSIFLDIAKKPFYFKYYGKQQVIRSSVIITRNMITEGYLREISDRTDNNPHALLIEKWLTLDNTVINTSKR